MVEQGLNVSISNLRSLKVEGTISARCYIHYNSNICSKKVKSPQVNPVILNIFLFSLWLPTFLGMVWSGIDMSYSTTQSLEIHNRIFYVALQYQTNTASRGIIRLRKSKAPPHRHHVVEEWPSSLLPLFPFAILCSCHFLNRMLT